MTAGLTAIDGRSQFDAAVRAVLEQARSRGSAEIVCVDPDFAAWPLNDADVVETLRGWVSSRRRLVLFASDFDEVGRRQHRLVEWRRQWSHVVQCRSDPDLQAEQVPTLLFVPAVRCCVCSTAFTIAAPCRLRRSIWPKPATPLTRFCNVRTRPFR